MARSARPKHAEGACHEPAWTDARRMVAVREARRAYRKFHASCFWAHPPHLQIGMDDVPWVAGQLMKHGDREAWLVGRRLCR